jgi:hypothetical protein
MKSILKYAVLTAVLAFFANTAAMADSWWWWPPPSPTHKHVAPEVDPAMAAIGLSLLAGSVTVLRARRRK